MNESVYLAMNVSLFVVFGLSTLCIFLVCDLVEKIVRKVFCKPAFNREQSQQIIKNKLNKSIRRASGLTDKEFLFKYGFQN